MTNGGRTIDVESVDHTFRVYDGDELLTGSVHQVTPHAPWRFQASPPPSPGKRRQLSLATELTSLHFAGRPATYRW